MAPKASIDWTVARKILLILFGATVLMAMLTTCIPTQGSATRTPAVLSDAERKVKAERIVKNRLRDEDSARFRNTFLTESNNYCGQVNAKNALGGYGGYQRFIVLRLGTIMLEEDFSPYEFNINWDIHC